jgi:hypothetical protein
MYIMRITICRQYDMMIMTARAINIAAAILVPVMASSLRILGPHNESNRALATTLAIVPAITDG